MVCLCSSWHDLHSLLPPPASARPLNIWFLFRSVPLQFDVELGGGTPRPCPRNRAMRTRSLHWYHRRGRSFYPPLIVDVSLATTPCGRMKASSTVVVSVII